MSIQQEIDTLAPWFQAITFPDGECTGGVRAGGWDVVGTLDTLLAACDLAGRTVLDIGCMAGAAMLWAEARGARCVGFDIEPRCVAQAALVKREFGAAFEVAQADIEGYVEEEGMGQVDVVFFLGVYYHLRNPLLGLERAWAATKDLLVVEGEVWEGESGCKALYCPGEYKGDGSNWWVPTVDCLRAWLDELPGGRVVSFVYPLNGFPSRAGAVIERMA